MQITWSTYDKFESFHAYARDASDRDVTKDDERRDTCQDSSWHANGNAYANTSSHGIAFRYD